MRQQHKTNYFCQDCYKTYTMYWDSAYTNSKNQGFHDGNGNPITKVWGKCDNCGGKLVVD